MYIGLPNYSNNWKRIGFTDEDATTAAATGSWTALVVWGDEEAIARRVDGAAPRAPTTSASRC